MTPIPFFLPIFTKDLPAWVSLTMFGIAVVACVFTVIVLWRMK